MNTIDLLELICQQDNSIIEASLIYLMKKGKIDYTSLSNAYVHHLKEENDNRKSMMAEANACIMESFDRKKTDKKNINDKNYKHTQRCLYTLNKGKFFKMNEMNKKYGYDEKYAETLTNL